jgi:hypothetical protein
MLSKRRFLKGAAAATLAASLPWQRARALTSGKRRLPGSPPAELVVFNERYADARAFAAALAAGGAATLPLAGDAGVLWYGRLRPLVSLPGTRIIGMGTHTDLFILETLARDVRMSVRYRGTHDCRGRSTLDHVFSGNEPVRRLAGEVACSGSTWPAMLAKALHDYGRTEEPVAGRAVPRASCTQRTRTDVARSEDHPGVLVSWVLT